MSALTKKRPTDTELEVTVAAGAIRRFIGGKGRLKPLLSVLKRFEFSEVSRDTESVSWESVAGDRLRAFGKPGLALRGARAKEGMSQAELARRLNILQTNLSKMENGRRPIGKDMARRLASILDVDYRIFL